MNLLEALRDLERLDPDATIWIGSDRPWGPESRVLIAPELAPGGSPDPSFEYFLEIFVILETLGPPGPDLAAFAQRVIHYARHDA
jgi:hypothetical protein